jgi:hypothetical protein
MRYPWQKLSSVEALAACGLTVLLGSGGAALAAGGAAAASCCPHTISRRSPGPAAIRAYVIHEANQSREAPAGSQNTAQ